MRQMAGGESGDLFTRVWSILEVHGSQEKEGEGKRGNDLPIQCDGA